MNVENLMPNTIVDRKYLGFTNDIKQCERHIFICHVLKEITLQPPSSCRPLFSNLCHALIRGAVLLHNVLVSKVVLYALPKLQMFEGATSDNNRYKLNLTIAFYLMNHNKSLEVFLST